MKIKIIPENDAEKRRFQEKFNADKIEHSGVKEYLIFGNKTEKNNFSDFHEWTGAYRYLLGSLSYFYEVINDLRKADAKPSNVEVINQDFFKQNQFESKGKASATPNMIKRGQVDNPNIAELDIDKLAADLKIQNQPKVIQFNPQQMEEDGETFEDQQKYDEEQDGGRTENLDGFEDEIPPPPPTVE